MKHKDQITSAHLPFKEPVSLVRASVSDAKLASALFEKVSLRLSESRARTSAEGTVTDSSRPEPRAEAEGTSS